MKAYKLELIVVDHSGIGLGEILNSLDYFDYSFDITETQEADIGEWSDDHPLNLGSTSTEEKRKYFENGETK